MRVLLVEGGIQTINLILALFILGTGIDIAFLRIQALKIYIQKNS